MNVMSQPNIPNSNEVQQLLYVYEVLENQEKSIVQQMNMVESQTQGVDLTKRTMEEFKTVSPGHETMIPVGTNAFTSATLLNPKKVLVRINSDILIEKDLDEGIKGMQEMLNTYKNIYEKLNLQLNEVQSKLKELKPQIEQIYRNQGMQPQR